MTKAIRKFTTQNGLLPTFLFVTMAFLIGLSGLSFCETAYSQLRTTPGPQADQRPSLYNRNYHQGYQTGFGQGQMDWRNGTYRDSQQLTQSQQRQQAYEQGLNASEESTKGYQLGFKLGYSDGYYGRARNPAIPANARSLANLASANDTARANEPRRKGSRPLYFPPLSVADNTEMHVRLTTPVNTRTAKAGDRFTAAITSPARYEGASVEGHIVSVNRPGQLAGRTEMTLAFDSITLEDRQQGPFTAELEKVTPAEKVRTVDKEGGLETARRRRDREGPGGVAGGGKDTVIGLLRGGAAGGGTVYIEGNNDLILDPGTEMIVRTIATR